MAHEHISIINIITIGILILFEKQENNSLYKHYFSYRKIIQSSHYKVETVKLKTRSQTRVV